jgi:hypothetical protein
MLFDLQVVEWYYSMRSGYLEVAKELIDEKAFSMSHELDGFMHLSTILFSVKKYFATNYSTANHSMFTAVSG